MGFWLELAGTFVYMLVRLYTVSPLVVGSALAILMTLVGPVESGSFNPALDVATMFADRGRRWRLVGHWVAQLGGAILAGLAFKALAS